MCFRFDSCFGVGRDHDDTWSPPAKVVPHHHHGATMTPHQPPVQRNGHYYYGQGHQGFHHGHAQHQHQGFRHQTATSNATRRGPAPALAAAKDDALKHPAWNAKVGDDDAAHRGAQYYYYHHREPGHKEDTIDHERY